MGLNALGADRKPERPGSEFTFVASPRVFVRRHEFHGFSKLSHPPPRQVADQGGSFRRSAHGKGHDSSLADATDAFRLAGR